LKRIVNRYRGPNIAKIEIKYRNNPIFNLNNRVFKTNISCFGVCNNAKASFILPKPDITVFGPDASLQ
jgi:hypothetical protein